ncbi:hypothetical protein RQP46_006917 [Phenoliferia psychrophenolica]
MVSSSKISRAHAHASRIADSLDPRRITTHREFPFIRVDAFDGDPARVNPYSTRAPHFYLLTHAHTDHITGLNSPTFEGEIYCTAATKALLLGTIEAGDRVLHEELPHVDRKYKFANLRKVQKGRGQGTGRSGGDKIKVLEYNTATKIDGPQGPVTVTALDANHCPGSAMFLIESEVDDIPRAVLVTGDVRAEPHWVAALQQNPAVAKYIRWPHEVLPKLSLDRKGKGKERDEDRWPTLDSIYLDTTAVLLNEELVPKKEAVSSMVRLMAAYPSDTKFFLNAWTWGYEEILKGVALAFNTKIHLDSYKARTYHSIASSEPLLASLGTSRPDNTRMHACERRWKCDEVWADGRGCYEFANEHLVQLEGPKKLKRPGVGGREAEDRKVVYVNPSAMTRKRWETYKKAMDEKVKERSVQEQGDGKKRPHSPEELLPNYLIVPLARHSSLPELQALVSLFKPRTLYPLTITDDSRTPCRDYLALSSLFASHLAPGGASQLDSEAKAYTKTLVAHRARPRSSLSPADASTLDMGENNLGYFVQTLSPAFLMNIEGGDDVAKDVEVWARDELPPPPLLSPSKRSSPPAAAKRARPVEQPALPSSSFSPKKPLFLDGGPPPPVVDRLAHSTRPRPPPSPRTILVPATPSSAPNLLLPSPNIHPAPLMKPSRSVGSELAPALKQPRSSNASSRPEQRVVTFLSPARSSAASSSSTSPHTQRHTTAAPSPPLATTSANLFSPELVLPPPSPLRGPDPTSAIPLLTTTTTITTTKRSPHMITSRPSAESRLDRRHRAGRIIRDIGGKLGPNRTIIPLKRSDPMWEWAYGEKGRKADEEVARKKRKLRGEPEEEEEPASFQNVPGSVS